MSDFQTIASEIIYKGKKINLVYRDTDSFENLPYKKVSQCYGICFYEDKIVIGGHDDHWNLIGGTKEKDETYEETLRREVQEESNMKVIKSAPIGYQHVMPEDVYQLRFVVLVEPYGEFTEDPAGSVKEIKLIDTKDFKKYIDWGDIGDRILERSIELRRIL